MEIDPSSFQTFLQNERALLGKNEPVHIPYQVVKDLSAEYLRQLNGFVPDPCDNFNFLLKDYIELYEKGTAIGHVMMDLYTLPFMEHLDLSYVKQAQIMLFIIEKWTLSPYQTFALPTKPAIYAMLDLNAKIIQIDLGFGYWARMLEHAGGSVILAQDSIRLRPDQCSWDKRKERQNQMFHRSKRSMLKILDFKHYHRRALMVCAGCKDKEILNVIQKYTGNHVYMVCEKKEETDLATYLQLFWNEIRIIELPIIWHQEGAFKYFLFIYERLKKS